MKFVVQRPFQKAKANKETHARNDSYRNVSPPFSNLARLLGVSRFHPSAEAEWSWLGKSGQERSSNYAKLTKGGSPVLCGIIRMLRRRLL